MMISLSMPDLRRIAVWALVAGVVLLWADSEAVAQTEDDSEDAVAIFNQAQDLHERGDLAGAIKLYEKALHTVPEFPEAEYQRGMAELGLGNKAEAEKSFRRALELREDWSPAMTSLGSLLVESGQFGEAEKLLSKALAADPQNSAANPTVSIWAARAALETALGQRGAAKQSIENALAIDPKNRPALFLSADLALSENDIVKAKEAASALEKLSANTDSLNLLRASIAAAEGDTEGASKLLTSLPADSAKANELRSRIASNIATAADLEKQLDADPKNVAVLGRLCTLLRRDAPLKAIDYCRRSSEAEPGNIGHVIGYAAALVQARQFDKAVNLLRKLIEIAPDNSTAHANLATALFELKRYAEAKAEFEWLTAKQPNLAVAYYFLAICHDQLREFPDAMANYQQYLRLADPVANKLDIEKVTLRLPELQKQLKKK
jgi:tetratricopeptide (TPR) repeat protein